ncbi:response regulator transcription factor [Bacillus horti]|uniref:Two-component system response regulator YesN n=1 Tax=Caldalkalibacillus horti TaxID=77523 RepID=A0ABT9VWF5_9BACI|nr:response regulator [Bacillus horti]MDQ0165199.1 two-component system response regulator YesN [Bacillus horti]
MKVLIIEDEPLIRKGLSTLLRQVDVKDFTLEQIVEAEHAEEAERWLERQSFDFVLTDIEMGEMNGLQLIKRWRQKREDTQWVIISGYDYFEFAQEAILNGVREYVLKPVTKRKMKEVVERLVEHYRARQPDFIGADEVEEIIGHLEEFIWSLKQTEVKKIIDDWSEQMKTRQLSLAYFSRLVEHIFGVLHSRLGQKGSHFSFEKQVQMEGESLRDISQKFEQQCLYLLHKVEDQRKGNEIDPIEVAKSYILEHIDQELGLDDVARRLGLNSSYFSQLFKKETGETFVKYRMRLRMERAKELLLRKDIRIIDIPSLIGCNDHPHFTKTFKKYTGQTPSKFRVQMGVDH